jgi:PAS domain S-box-containing protein
MSSQTSRFESLLEAAPDALVGMDQKGVIRFVNRQTESLFGYDRDQLVGQPIETLVPECLWQIYAELRQDYFADPRTRSSALEVELIGLGHDGNGFPVNVSLSQIDTGDVLLVITAVREVTRQKEAIRDAQLLASIVEYCDDAIIATTLDGTITSWNPAAERIYGYSSREIVGRSENLLAPQDRASEMDAVLAKIKAGKPVRQLETNRVRKDGNMVWVSLSVAPIRDENNAIVGACEIDRDVSEQAHALPAPTSSPEPISAA